jgi:hypothetical protein
MTNHKSRVRCVVGVRLATRFIFASPGQAASGGKPARACGIVSARAPENVQERQRFHQISTQRHCPCRAENIIGAQRTGRKIPARISRLAPLFEARNLIRTMGLSPLAPARDPSRARPDNLNWLGWFPCACSADACAVHHVGLSRVLQVKTIKGRMQKLGVQCEK